MLEIVNDVRSVEVDPESLQLDAMDGNWNEASNSRDTCIFATWVSEEK